MHRSALRTRYCFFTILAKAIFFLQSLQVMYDAFGVRLHAGRQAEV
jgi:acid phosphatase family membrane protein YuiD